MSIENTVINNSDFLKNMKDKISSKSLQILSSLPYQLQFFFHKDSNSHPFDS